ncbi:MAG: EAL domain-containing protein [Gemmatimonadales bacterium]|nr:EAL domain-containing protein [Gemmatimonadales bacterium]MBP6571886.1 EAL domain-containing protein [Gemmatimonadales bacterium]MBP7620547.1 EAL domain-containing protein [Gemmatimonadales bacterium]
MALKQQQALTVLYDLAMTMAGETDPRRLATSMLQRLLAHTGYSCGAVLLDLRDEGDATVSADLYVTIGARALRALEGTRGLWPASAMAAGRLVNPSGWFPGGERYPHAMQLPLPGVGCVLLLAASTSSAREEQAVALLPPLLAKFSQALRHCLESKARGEALAVARDAAEAASRAKSRFLASMSHELRTPLNGILGYAQLVELEEGLPAQLRDHAHAITAAGHHLLAVVNDILDLTRIESGQLTIQVAPIDVAPLLAATISHHEAAARQRDIRLVTAGSDASLRVLADEHRLRQVLDNLVSNAIKYNQSNGQVSLIVTQSASDRVRFTVTDTGRGIAPELQAELFQPFNRLGAETGTIQGIGIGLLITRHLVDGMGGAIGVDSTPGVGSTFWVDLPSAEPRVVASSAAGGSRRRRILVAEDFGPNQAVLRLQLTRLGYDVDVTSDGGEALARWRAEPFDLLLTDLNMPGLDGFDLARAIRAEERERGGHLPIVAITAADLSSEREQCRDAGMDDVLPKPIILVDLRRLLERLLDGENAAEASPDPRAAADTVAVLDLAQLHRVLGEVSPEEWRGVLGTFIDSAGQGLRRIAASPGDVPAVARELHKLKSGARTVGAMRFAAHVVAMEDAVNNGHRITFSALRGALTDVELALAGLATAAPTPPAKPVVPEPTRPRIACRSVLLVDDDPVVIRHMSAMLSFGLAIPDVLTASDGRQAADLLAARDGAIDVVICDLEMPEMDGVELIRSLGRTGFQGGVILMSGAEAKVLSTVGTLAGIQGLHVLGQVQKPVGPAQMTQLLAQFDAEVAPQRDRRALEEITADAIREGIRLGEFEVWFQPKVDAATLAPVGVEALARWVRGKAIHVAPDRFIVAAERLGLIPELSRALVDAALSGAARLAAHGAGLTVAINISRQMLDDLSLPDWISARTLAVGLTPQAVVLEVTETGLSEDLTRALDVLTRLRLKGFGLSIDDFGIGYSSFEQLGRVPFTELKLDRSFVSRGCQDPAARAILEGSMGMARKLGLTTVAKGSRPSRILS